jgi:hypothetical protein
LLCFILDAKSHGRLHKILGMPLSRRYARRYTCYGKHYLLRTAEPIGGVMVRQSCAASFSAPELSYCLSHYCSALQVKEIIYPLGAKIDVREVRLGDETMSVLEIWGAEYQENDCLLIDGADRDLLETVCARERCLMQVRGPLLSLLNDSFRFSPSVGVFFRVHRNNVLCRSVAPLPFPRLWKSFRLPEWELSAPLLHERMLLVFSYLLSTGWGQYRIITTARM